MATSSNGARKSLVARTLERCRSGLSRIGAATGRTSPVAGYFPVHVGPAEGAVHPLFRRLILDDAEREHGHAPWGPLALPSCDVDAFLDVLWHMEHGGNDGEIATALPSPICGWRSGSKGGAAGCRTLSPRSYSGGC